MAVPYVNDKIFDQGLNYLKANCTRVVACVGEPASFAEANANLGVGAGKRVAQATAATGDFTVAAGTGDVQRRVTYAGTLVSAGGLVAGNPTVLAWLDVTNSEILALTGENGAAAVTVGADITFPAVDVVRLVAPVAA